MQKDKVFFVGSSRCFHTMDWYKSAQQIVGKKKNVVIFTDLIEGEGYERIIENDDEVKKLFIIDKYLFRSQGRLQNIWRNLVKFAVLPIQSLILRFKGRKHGVTVVHAHSTYYMALCRLARLPYVGTPQGSEVLVRPFRSVFYRWFLWYAVSGACRVTVDSAAMAEKLRLLFKIDADIVQNGISIQDALAVRNGNCRKTLVSMRGVTSNYRVHELLDARNRERLDIACEFCYPFGDKQDLIRLRAAMRSEDKDLGRLSRAELCRVLSESLAAVSIPKSDSSPRSVYEAIFSGAVVMAADAGWIGALPRCMRNRVVVVDPADEGWLGKALVEAEKIRKSRYEPSADAIAAFDQRESMKKILGILSSLSEEFRQKQVNKK